MKKPFLLATTMLVAATTAAVPAFAQQQGAPPPADLTTDAGVKSTVGLQEIIVTANRRSESQQRLAIPLDVVTGVTLERQGITQAEDLNRLVPGLGLAANGTITQTYIRGVGTFSAPGGDSSVLTTLDGVVFGNNAYIAGNFYDLARVEVLKGPQGTLYGRNATAGAINLISARPEFELGGRAGLEVGNYDAWKVDGFVNVPLSETLAVRAAGQIFSHDAYFTQNQGTEKGESVRLQALYKSEGGFSLLLNGRYNNLHGTGTPYVQVPFVDSGNHYVSGSDPRANAVLQASNPFNYAIQPDNKANVKSWGVTAEMNLDLGFATLTAIPAYLHFHSNQVINPGFRISSVYTGHQTTVETRLASNENGPLKWIVGAFYYDNYNSGFNFVEQGTFASTFVVPKKSFSYAFFGETTYSLADTLRLTGGLRYTYDRTKLTNGFADTIRQSPPGPPQPPIILPPGAGDYAFSGRTTSKNVSYKVGVEFDVAPKSLLYATVATGFRAGGVNSDLAPNTYRPEKLTAYTVGMKNRFFENKLTANVELFYWDYKNHQENILSVLNASVLVGPTFSVIFQNIGKSSVKGANLDLTYRPASNTTFKAVIEYLDATFDKYNYVAPLPIAAVQGTTTCGLTRIAPTPEVPPPAQPFTGTTRVNCNGKPFTRAPDVSATVSVEQRFPLANAAVIIAGANAQIATSSFIATDYVANEKQDSYAIVGLDLTYSSAGDRWAIGGFVRNLTKQSVLTSAFERPFNPGLVYATLRAPRTYGLKAHFNF